MQGEAKNIGFPLENEHFWKQMKICWKAWERKILIFPKENEGFLGGPDRGGWMVGTGERKTIGFPLEKCTFLGIDEGLLEGLGTQNIDFPKGK